MKNSNFKTQISLVCVAAGLSGLLLSSAHATPVNITMSLPLNSSSTLVGDVQAQNIPGSGLGNANVLSWLQLDVSTYDSNLGQNLVAPADLSTYSGESTSGTLSVGAGDYLVLHYGAGQGGSPSGGLVALYFATAGDYSIPQSGGGPNGNGGISFVSFYGGDGSVPDGATTATLLGGSLVVIGMIRRKLNV